MVNRSSDQDNFGRYVYKGMYYKGIGNMLGSEEWSHHHLYLNNKKKKQGQVTEW